MFWKAILDGILNVRYSVCDFMVRPLAGWSPHCTMVQCPMVAGRAALPARTEKQIPLKMGTEGLARKIAGTLVDGGETAQ